MKILFKNFNNINLFWNSDNKYSDNGENIETKIITYEH